MTLCILTSSYPRSPEDSINAGVFVRDFALAVHREGREVMIFTHRKRGGFESSEPFEVHHFDWAGDETSLTSIDLASPAGMRKTLSLIRRGTRDYLEVCRKRCVSRSLAMWAVPSGYFAMRAAARLGIPYSVWALGSDVWRYRRHRLGAPLLSRIFRGASSLFADGIELAESVRGISGRECSFLPSSRDLSCFSPRPLDLEPGRMHVLFVGRYESNKGPDVLVEAALRYLEQGGRARFHLHGQGGMESDLRQVVSRAGREDSIFIRGVLDPQGVVDAMSACDCLVVPSRVESIPVICSDAFQMRLPMIVTDVGDMGSIVRDAGVGTVVPPGDPEAMCRALQEMEGADRESMRQGMSDLSLRFRPEAAAREFLDKAFAGEVGNR